MFSFDKLRSIHLFDNPPQVRFSTPKPPRLPVTEGYFINCTVSHEASNNITVGKYSNLTTDDMEELRRQDVSIDDGNNP